MAIAFKTHSHGKLLLTGEYLILEGAVGLAVPLQKGQSMKVIEGQGAEVHWVAKDHQGGKWFECKMNLIDFSIEKTNNEEKAAYLQSLIKSAAQLNSDFLSQWKKYKVTCELEFDPAWGLGSSSSLITNLAHWAELSPFELYFDTQQGSGYDVAAAMSDEPLLYQKIDDELSFETFEWNRELMDSMLVFYQGHKQSSLEEVRTWKSNRKWKQSDVDQASTISESLAECEQVDEAVKLLRQQLKLMENILDRTAFDGRFSDFQGVVKPLGAWGGDFGLALHPDVDYARQYLRKKNIDTIFSLGEIAVK